MHLICKVQEKFYMQRALIYFLPECVRLHDKHRKTTGTHFPSHKTGREAKISASGLVSKFYNKSRKQAIQQREDGPQSISRLESLRVPVKFYVQVGSVDELED